MSFFKKIFLRLPINENTPDAAIAHNNRGAIASAGPLNIEALPMITVPTVRSSRYTTVIENAYAFGEGEHYLLTHRLYQCILLAVGSANSRRTLVKRFCHSVTLIRREGSV